MTVHERLSRHLLVDGLPVVLDLARSSGSWLVDARDGRRHLDFFTSYASSPLGFNPFDDDPAFLARLGRLAANKPANSDLYTEELADFTDTFTRVLGDPELPHLFLVEGGSAAVENALKVAFDWKSRWNEANGRHPGLGTQVLHLSRAFHGRGGYTLSLTNTEPVKTDRFPKFGWPRIDSPAIHLGDVEAAERHALGQAEEAFRKYPHDIACFIAEPIQCEAGDNHLRPEFLRAMQDLCHRHEALFVLDEVQTGVGVTGSAWAYRALGLQPDVVAFAKKMQVGGVMAGRRVDLVPDNVFRVSGRINSTWGGGLTDIVRATRVLRIVERDGLIEHAGVLGDKLLGALRELEAEGLLRNARGRGLLAAFDVPDRDAVVTRLRERESLLVLPASEGTVRLRPPLNVTPEEIEVGLSRLRRGLAT
ncbi:L-lysine 6-transaminase [Herbidospora yilanensis]|uniref:L-lysine 6-transaminase n=1 Tax=Herbidospora yilanensis TaxID=354426 RepID=UPI000782D684|nr:L-lysine 6-transaminase [Herbidospora yilanensis]